MIATTRQLGSTAVHVKSCTNFAQVDWTRCDCRKSCDKSKCRHCIVRKVVTRASAGTAPPVPGNLPRVAQCCCHAAVTNRSSEPLSFVFFNLQAVPVSVIHLSCLTKRGRWVVFFMIKVITSLVLVKGVIDEFVQNTKIKVIYREWHYSYSVVNTMGRGRSPAPY